MPNYDYKCEGCHRELEAHRQIPMRDDGPVCRTCGSPMHRKMSSPALVNIQGGTRNHQRIKMWSLEDRLKAKDGDNF